MTRRVLVVNPGADVYGSDLQMLESLEGFRDAGWPILVVLPERGPLVEVLSRRGIPHRIVPFPVVRRSALSSAGFARLLGHVVMRQGPLVRFLRHAAPDVVYVNTSTVPWWLSAARLAGVPAVCHLHEAENADPRWVRAALNGPLGLATAVIVNSDCAREAAVEAWPPLRSKLSRVYNGVPDRPDPVVPPPPAAPFRVATLSRLSPRKGVHVALDAVALLRRADRDVFIEIAGSAFEGYEWYVDRLRRQADAPELRQAVRFSGYVSPVWPVLDRAHAVLFPSVLDSFGNALVEAQLSERPVVATAVMGHLETVRAGRTGLHVPVDDARAMADAVAWLMDHPEAGAKLAAAARDHAQRAFGVQRYRRQVCTVVDTACASRGALRETRRLVGPAARPVQRARANEAGPAVTARGTR